MSDKVMDFLNSVAKQLESQSLYVGFVDGATYPDGTSVASVAIENEFGVPEKNQPARPFFRNAIALKQSEWSDIMGRGLRSGQSVQNVLEVMGAVIAGDVRDSIISLVDPALADYTIEQRQKRGNDSTKPLEDTKTMLNDVSYEVRDNESP